MLTYREKTVTLDLKPITQFKLAQAGYTLRDLLNDGTSRQLLCGLELFRICAAAEESAEEIAAGLEDFQQLNTALESLLESELAKLEPEEKTPEGNE